MSFVFNFPIQLPSTGRCGCLFAGKISDEPEVSNFLFDPCKLVIIRTGIMSSIFSSIR